MSDGDTERIERMKRALVNSWSIQSSSKWSLVNPAKGQCGVTALVVQDFLGGEIKKTKVKNSWHFYNVIAGERYDFTETQFDEMIDYTNFPSNRDEAYLDTNDAQYCYLKQKVKLLFREGGR
jgi:hypothetical protein